MKARNPPHRRQVEDLTEDEAASEQERLKRKWASAEAFVGSDKRLALAAQDLVKHFEHREAALDGKAMVVHEPAHLRGALRRDQRVTTTMALRR